jgi:hypothetical protein
VRATLLLLTLAAVAACAPDPPSGEGEGEGEGEAVEPAGTIVVEPGACDFGRVALGGISICSLAIRNAGVADLVVDDATYVDADGALDVAAPFLPLVNIGVLAPGASVDIDVRLSASLEGGVSGVLRFRSNDVVTPIVDVPLSAVVVAPPQCRIRIASINGAALGINEEAPAIELLDDVVLSLDASDADAETGSLVRQEWAFVSQPAASSATLTSTGLVETSFEPDVAGDYEVCAQVFNDLGVGSVNACCIIVSAGAT